MNATQSKITLWGIEVFIATAEEGSITAAARRLGASPAAISQQISNLEAAVGTMLLDRSARPVRPTASGDMFLLRANTILNEAIQAKAELSRADLAGMTRFRLGMIEDFDADVTPAILADLGAKWQNCKFLLETGASHRLLDQLEARALDLVVTAEMGPLPEAMETYPLMEEPFIIAAPKGASSPRDILRYLKESPFIHYTTRQHMGRQITDHLARQNLTLHHRFELDSYHSILAMVAHGSGWAILTPLGWMRAGRFKDQVDVFELPFEHLCRKIQITARKDVLGSVPLQIAVELRSKIEDLIVGPAKDALPWLGYTMKVLGQDD